MIEMESFLDSLLRVSVAFIMLHIIIRLIGNKQLGQLNIFTYITGIVIGSVAGDLLVHTSIKIMDAVTGIAIWGLLTIIFEFISMKLKGVCSVLNNQPMIVIKKGNIIYEKLKKNRLTIDELTMLLRTNNVFSVTEVEYAILEPNGELSILKKPGLETVVKDDLNIAVEKIKNVQTVLISEGKINKRNLREVNKSDTWLYKQLSKQHISTEKDVLYAELQSDDSLYVQKR